MHHAVETNQTFFPHPIFWHGVRGYELLYVNRHVSKETLIILCGDNLFKLRPPFATSTFLQKIGAVNTSRIRSIYLNIRCERVLQYGIDWISALRLLRENYQYLRRMTVNLVGWPIVFEDWSIPFHRLRLSADTPFHRLRLSADTHFEMSTRRAILRELGQFRGIGCVTITRAPVSTSTAAHVELLESMMTTPR